MEESATAIRLTEVTKHFGKLAPLDGVSLTIGRASRVVLTGSSGCGKTTLLRMVAGLDAPSDGSVELDGQLASRPRRIEIAPSQRGISMLFQDLGLWPNLRAGSNILIGLSGAKLTRTEKRQRLAACAQSLGITDCLSRKPEQLSAGQQQRVALGRSLISQPRLLLLDEPFTALDLSLKDKLYELLSAYILRHRPTVLLVSHDPLDAMGLGADRLLVLNRGKIECDAPFPLSAEQELEGETAAVWQKALLAR